MRHHDHLCPDLSVHDLNHCPFAAQCEINALPRLQHRCDCGIVTRQAAVLLNGGHVGHTVTTTEEE